MRLSSDEKDALLAGTGWALVSEAVRAGPAAKAKVRTTRRAALRFMPESINSGADGQAFRCLFAIIARERIFYEKDIFKDDS
jgi:hypothetical protein